MRKKEVCEVCGRSTPKVIAIIEGATLRVCKECAKAGRVIDKIYTHKSKGDDKEERAYKRAKPITTEDIVENYSGMIRKKRQELKIPIPVMAERLKEKESYLYGIENGSIKPSIDTAKKIGKFLGINIIEEVEVEPAAYGSKKRQEKTKGEKATLEDYLE